MSHREELTTEQAALVLAMLSGDATPDEVTRLDDLLRADPHLVAPVVDMIGQEAWLTWTCSSEAGDSRPLDRRTDSAVSGAGAGARAQASPSQSKVQGFLSSWANLAAAAVVLFAAGAILGALAIDRYEPAEPEVAVLRNDRPPAPGLTYRARLIETSACRWGPSARSMLNTDGTLRQGESVNLLEGIARLRVETVECTATLDIEGPAGLVLTADGGCSVTHGLVSANVNSHTVPFTIDTPSCQVSVAPGQASIGLSVDGRDVDIHAFSGQVAVVVPWGNDQLDSQNYDLEAGEALLLAGDSRGKFVITQADSEPSRFASRTSMKTDHLVIPEIYSEAVLSHAPLVYWRFDDGDSQQIANHAGEKYEGLVEGNLAWHQAGRNGYVGFASGVSEAELSTYIVANEPIDFGSAEAYSLELWMKPSHYHHCSLVAMFVPDDAARGKDHGVLLELGGPTALNYSLVEPGKVRFLHRSPPGAAVDAGTACFSSSNYEVRQWQHIVAVKSADELRLYIDGQLVASRADDSPMTDDLRLILGQLDDSRYMRRFVGQMDEVALYPTALSETVVQDHYNLVKQASQKPTALPPNDEI